MNQWANIQQERLYASIPLSVDAVSRGVLLNNALQCSC